MKKAEYGPAELIVNSAILKDVKTKLLLEKGSRIYFEGRQHVGEIRFDIDSMYQEFSKEGI